MATTKRASTSPSSSTAAKAGTSKKATRSTTSKGGKTIAKMVKLKPPATTKPAKTALGEAKPATKPAKATSTQSKHPHTAALLELRAYGLSYPDAHTKSPWPGHMDLAVRDKTFAYLSIEGEPLHISCKLPHSCQAALDLAFTEPTGYGLGKSGWVTANFSDTEQPPVEFLKSWIDESYRAQAPKTLVKTLPPRDA